ncbi:heparan-alpha-glucosaminide N-acetyltransferase domain-containing protein [Leptospira ryugenii]|uniref:heparan-alpha-glucosaminide N-acetyltransferase domain-containing protein n=1 Tax=Leptospira ryugenii TaxID=1917863 RepID=UPI000D5981D9|nr:heparan-alpha-glucosaminide N-acetyltransferase domain-containing protein [Leptospira ryugenii]
MRDQSIDILRGLFVFLMILVNLPGSWGAMYTPLQHAEKTGIHLADLVFPGFLYVLGFSYYLQIANENSIRSWKKAVFRVFLIFLLGIFLSLFPKWNWEEFRLMGVLQRIALVYAIIYLLLPKAKLGPSFWLSFFFLSLLSLGNEFWNQRLGGFQWESFETKESLSAYLDRFLLGKHIWKPDYDPEGVLTTIISVQSALLGFLSAWFRQNKKDTLIQLAFVFLLFALVITIPRPPSKLFWNLSFVFWNACFCTLFLDLIQRGQRVSIGFQVAYWMFSPFGRHALLLFFLMGFLARLEIYRTSIKIGFGFLAKVSKDPKLSSLLISFALYLCFLFLLFLYDSLSRQPRRNESSMQ